MIRKWFGVSALVVIASAFLSLSSCGREQQLVSIQVQPTSETFGASDIQLSQDAGAQVQLRALGTFIHPPVTKDITSQVVWASNTPQMMTVDANGLVTVTGGACGSTLISATVTSNKSSGGISSSGSACHGIHDRKRRVFYGYIGWRRRIGAEHYGEFSGNRIGIRDQQFPRASVAQLVPFVPAILFRVGAVYRSRLLRTEPLEVGPDVIPWMEPG